MLARSSIVKLVPIREIVTQSMILINFKLNESVIIYWVIVFLSVLFQPSSHKQIHTQEEEKRPLFSFVASNNIIRDCFLTHSQKKHRRNQPSAKIIPPSQITTKSPTEQDRIGRSVLHNHNHTHKNKQTLRTKSRLFL